MSLLKTMKSPSNRGTGQISNKKAGSEAENRACEYLVHHGLTLLEKNYLCSFGEIDLIMQDNDMIVFVEVRKRSNIQYGNALESVNYTKQQRLIRASRHYLQRKKLMYKMTSRFDLIAIHPIEGKLKLEWIKNVDFYR